MVYHLPAPLGHYMEGSFLCTAVIVKVDDACVSDCEFTEASDDALLPIYLFDDDAREIRSPSEWMAMGKLDPDDEATKLPAPEASSPATW